MDIEPDEMAAGHQDGMRCAEVPEFKRLRYFYGQMLGVHDFQSEQDYFREKIKLHNRCLHGYGVGCGLLVVPAPEDAPCGSEANAKQTELHEKLRAVESAIAAAANDQQRLAALQAQRETVQRNLDAAGPGGPAAPAPARVAVECGFALDCDGNEIVVRRPLSVDLVASLDSAERQLVQHQAVTLYLSICYCEQPVDPVRPVLQDACGARVDCSYGKLRDAVRIRVSTTPPQADLRCEPCCTPCHEPCLLLARIRDFRHGVPLSVTAIDNSVRRPLGPCQATTITGISWTHGAAYSNSDAARILGGGTDAGAATDGIKITFSRPVLVSTLTPGVIDFVVIEGGATRGAGVYQLEGEFIGLDPAKDTASEFRYRYTGDENLDQGDRVIIVVRCAFILDACCRPVDGAHVGGRVPMLADVEFAPFRRPAVLKDCVRAPGGHGPWTSGAGTPGASFESWFYVTNPTNAAEKAAPDRTDEGEERP